MKGRGFRGGLDKKNEENVARTRNCCGRPSCPHQSLSLIQEANELFRSIILYYQCQSGHDFISFNSQSIYIFQESDSGNFLFPNQELITLTP